MLASEVQTLLEKMAVQNDEAALKQLFYIFYPRLLAFADSFLKNKPVAEEITEDIFIKLWENRASLPLINNFSAYLFTAVKNGILNYQRPAKNQPYLNIDDTQTELTTDTRTPEDIFISTEALRNINAVIATLPPRCKLIFQLVKESGLKHKEVADLLNLSIKTVETQMAVALKKLSEALLDSKTETYPFLPKK